MSDEKKRILMVDDSADDIHVLMENLKQEYAVIAATSGAKALLLAEGEQRPDLILMDVTMPGMDGYETCRQLKANPVTEDIDVIFVSAHNTVEEILAGYEAGGSDYLIKPVQPAQLLQKVKLAIQNREARCTALAESRMAMQTAMTAITSVGEQGVVLDFMRRSFSVGSAEALANLVVEVTANYGLNNCVEVRGCGAVVYASNAGQVTPLEQELLSRLKDVGRIREHGSRLILNFGPITQLIKNMPEDSEKSGRLRDHLAILLEGAEARLRALEMEHQVAALVQDSNKALCEIQTVQTELKRKTMRIMDELMGGVEDAFVSYGMTDEQEKLLIGLVQASVDKTLENYEQGLKIDAQLREIIERLNGVSRR